MKTRDLFERYFIIFVLLYPYIAKHQLAAGPIHPFAHSTGGDYAPIRTDPSEFTFVHSFAFFGEEIVNSSHVHPGSFIDFNLIILFSVGEYF